MSVPTTPQAAPQPVAAPETPSIDDRIGNIARGFLSDLETNTDPDQIPEESPPEAEAPAEAPETPEAEKPIEEVLEEIELEGKQYRVPAELKGRFMADKDYRQKTMAVAAERKELEQMKATATQLAQQAQQMAPYHAQLFAMENRAQFLQQRLTQDRELAADPVEYNRVQGELSILLHQKDQFARGLQQVQSQFSAQIAQLRGQQLATLAPRLYEQYPDLKKPEAQQKLGSFIREEGFSDEEIAYLNFSAPGIRLAWEAMQYRQMVADQAKARAKLAEKEKTLPAATQSSRAADTSAKDKQARREWQKRGAKWNDPLFKPFGTR